MAIEEVAVGGVDAGPKPHSRVGELDALRGPLPRTSSAAGPDVAGIRCFEAERRGSLDAPTLEPLLEQVMVVIAGDDHQWRIADRRRELGEEGAGPIERRGQRAIAQLDGVAEQDHAVHALELGPQDPPKVGAAQAGRFRRSIRGGDRKELHRPHSRAHRAS